MSETRYRFHGRAVPTADRRTPLRAEKPSTRTSGSTAVLRLYDPIDSWGGYWGVSAREFADTLDDLDDDVDTIELHLNSPGGEVFEGIAILNALRRHQARIVVVVDGLAASAASFIAMAGDEVIMARNAELMIHDAWGVGVGNAETMRDLADRLDKVSDNIADVYASKAGGDVADWRAAMRDETWYSADEAVAAGLADRVEDASDADDAAAKNRWDLSLFAHAGRTNAPTPPLPAPAGQPTTETPAASADGHPENTPQEESMPLTDDLRQRLGIADENADEATILAALDEALAERADPQHPTTETPPLPEGIVAIEQSVLDDLRAAAEQGRQAREQQLAETRQRLVNEAVADGRIAPARRDHWLAQLEVDPGAADVLAGLQKGLVPVVERGHASSTARSEDDETYAALFGVEKGA